MHCVGVGVMWIALCCFGRVLAGDRLSLSCVDVCLRVPPPLGSWMQGFGMGRVFGWVVRGAVAAAGVSGVPPIVLSSTDGSTCRLEPSGALRDGASWTQIFFHVQIIFSFISGNLSKGLGITRLTKRP